MKIKQRMSKWLYNTTNKTKINILINNNTIKSNIKKKAKTINKTYINRNTIKLNQKIKKEISIQALTISSVHKLII